MADRGAMTRRTWKLLDVKDWLLLRATGHAVTVGSRSADKARTTAAELSQRLAGQAPQ